jgi:hypothetical protein
LKIRFLVFLGIVLLVLAGSGAYMVQRSVSLAPGLRPWAPGLWAFLGLFILLQLGVPMAHRLLGIRLAALHWVTYTAFSLVSSFFLYLAGIDLLRGLWDLAAGMPPAAGPRLLGTAALLTLGSALAGMVQCYRLPRVRQVDIPVRELPEDLHGFRIVQLSDLHLGPLLSPARMARIVDRANGLQADFVAVTGDLADGDVAQERRCLDELGRLHARHGIAFVTGNHDHYSGSGPWIQAVRELGWRVLLNAHVVIPVGGAELAVIGLPDPTAAAEGLPPNLDRAMAGVPRAAFKLLLFHPPTGTRRASRLGIHLQLSGHTHGGQYFPWSPIVRRFFDHPVGLCRRGGMWIHVSPGTGFWGPPNRFLVPAEITQLTLVPAGPEK